MNGAFLDALFVILGQEIEADCGISMICLICLVIVTWGAVGG
ncbi:hypothetical protein REC12_10595 [Desulfosporosinus sp. PR]|nr:hypothetical protein [Desulfosporosinus sp. PR]MDQ7094037.1 hypothetical protein [Desulfosporosinus sp. PR]